jgi:hypothetical protein
MAIRDGKIIALGTDQEVLRLADSTTKRIDLRPNRDTGAHRQPRASPGGLTSCITFAGNLRRSPK